MSSAPALSALQLMFAPRSPKLAKTGSSVVVVNGKRVTDLRQIARAERDCTGAEAIDEADLARVVELKREVQRAKERARYQRDRQDPEKRAKREAYYQANREKIIAWKREYDAAHRPEIRAAQTAWAARERLLNPELSRERSNRYYQRHRERLLEEKRLQRVAAKAAKAATEAAIDKAAQPANEGSK